MTPPISFTDALRRRRVLRLLATVACLCAVVSLLGSLAAPSADAAKGRGGRNTTTPDDDEDDDVVVTTTRAAVTVATTPATAPAPPASAVASAAVIAPPPPAPAPNPSAPLITIDLPIPTMPPTTAATVPPSTAAPTTAAPPTTAPRTTTVSTTPQRRQVRTRCGARTLTLEVRQESGRLRVRTSLAPKVADSWTATVLHDRKIAWRGKVKKAQLDYRMNDYAGSDVIGVRLSSASGGLCVAEVVLPA
jgi:hypothetical protein